MSVDSLKIIELLKSKEQAAKMLWDITDSTRFSGTEEEVDSYVEFIEKRQAYFDQIDSIDKTIKEMYNKNNKLYDQVRSEASVLENNIVEIINMIIEIDKPTNKKMNDLLKEIGSKAGKLGSGRKIMSAYQSQGSVNQTDGYFIDSKNWILIRTCKAKNKLEPIIVQVRTW